MSDPDADSQDTNMTDKIRFNVTTREKTIAILTGVVAFTVGLWVGLWMIPDAALSVPTDTYVDNGRTVRDVAYQPVPSYLPALSALLVGGGLYAAWSINRSPTETREDSDAESASTAIATDGGETDG